MKSNQFQIMQFSPKYLTAVLTRFSKPSVYEVGRADVQEMELSINVPVYLFITNVLKHENSTILEGMIEIPKRLKHGDIIEKEYVESWVTYKIPHDFTCLFQPKTETDPDSPISLVIGGNDRTVKAVSEAFVTVITRNITPIELAVKKNA